MLEEEKNNHSNLKKIDDIYKKLWSIQNKIKEIVRKEENKFQKYFFFNELQVLELLKPWLEKFKVTIFFTDDISEQFHLEQRGNIFIVRYLKKMEIIDIENTNDKNYKLTYNFWAIGANQDPAKAKGAAETYAIKYILTKFFLIPIRDIDDPDYNKNDFNSSFENSEKREKGSVEEFLKEYNLKK